MKLVINQNQVGKFNILGDSDQEETLAFSLAFKDDDGDIIKVNSSGIPLPKDSTEKGHLAVFNMPSNSCDPHGASQRYKDMFEERDFTGLLEEHRKHNGWTTGLDCPEQRVMFAYFIERYYEDICNNAIEREKKNDAELLKSYRDSIRRLEDKVYEVVDAQDTPNLFKVIIEDLEKKVETYQKWRDDYKEETENWTKWDARIKETLDKMDAIKSVRSMSHSLKG